MQKPVCVSCKCFYRPKKNGISWVEGMPIQRHSDGATEWRPYKVWSADLWACPQCNHEIVTGHARQPLTILHESDFDKILTRLPQDTIHVNDC